MLLPLIACFLVFGVSSRSPPKPEKLYMIPEPIFGKNCGADENGKPEMRWYYDAVRNRPYPFTYLGCGETNGLTYDMIPVIEDVSCPGFYENISSCTYGELSVAFPAPIEPNDCKDGEYCKADSMMEDNYGICCSNELAAKYNENQKATCPSGQTTVTNERGTLFGRMCSHNFCPVNSTCVEGDFEAYCCKRKRLNVQEVSETHPIFGRKCDNGEKGAPEIKWYYDESRYTPYPFLYLGCGETNGVAYGFTPLIMDHIGCPGFYTDGVGCTIGDLSNSFEKIEPEYCKTGDYCIGQPMMMNRGKCCSQDYKDRYQKNQEATCPKGERAVTDERGTLFGRRCSHNFCPTNSTCVDGDFEAYCCKKENIPTYEAKQTHPVFGRKCGSGEKGEPEIKWYYDESRYTPYPFLYLGCGETNGVGHGKTPQIMDYVGCLGFYSDGGSCTRGELSNSFQQIEPQYCKTGDYCTAQPMMRNHGRCCSRDFEARYEENTRASCPSGQNAVKFEGETFFGRRCSHHFCPVGSKCIDGDFEAYCCKK